jgi:uncharacterized Ntn-hydrolase superfamily protein
MAHPVPTTFSIVAVDREAREIGAAVQSKFLSVGAAVPWVQADIGAVVTQAFCNTTFGPRGLDLLASGRAPEEALYDLLSEDSGRDTRQVGIIDAAGRSASYTGSKCIGAAGGIADDDFAVQGNCLAAPAVYEAMAACFRSSTGSLADRLVAVLAAGQAAGGDKRGQQSAALIIEKPDGGYGGFSDRYVDLRVDDHPRPIEELARILELHKLYFFPPEPHDIFPIDEALGSEIVRELVRVRALGTGASRFDAAAAAALTAFMHIENLENRCRDDGAIDRQTLEYLRAHIPG